MVRHVIAAVLALFIIQAHSSPVFASYKKSEKVKAAARKSSLRRSWEHEIRQLKNQEPFEYKPRRGKCFKLTGRQLLFWLPLLITANAIYPVGAQQADAYVDCDDDGTCFNPAAEFVSPPISRPSLEALDGCAPFVNPQKLDVNTVHNIGAVLGHLQETPLVKSIARPGFLCGNLTIPERDYVTTRFRDLIAPKIASFVSLARSYGKKAGVLFGIVQTKCVSFYQQLELFKLARVLNITEVPAGFKHSDLPNVMHSASFYANITDYKSKPAHASTVNMAVLAHAVAFKLNVRSVYTYDDQSEQNTRFVINLQGIVKLANDIKMLYSSLSPRDHERAGLLRLLYDNLRPEKTKCPDFFETERDMAYGLSQIREDFIALIDGGVMAPLYKVLKSDTHWFLMVRPTRDLGAHIQGTLKGMGGHLVTKKCEEEFEEFVGIHNSTDIRTFPCAIHPILPLDFMMK